MGLFNEGCFRYHVNNIRHRVGDAARTSASRRHANVRRHVTLTIRNSNHHQRITFVNNHIRYRAKRDRIGSRTRNNRTIFVVTASKNPLNSRQ